MIAIHTSTLRYVVAAGAVAAALPLLPSPTEVRVEAPRIEAPAAPDVAAFYRTRDAALAPAVQAYLTEPHEGTVDVRDVFDMLHTTRRAQLAACLAVDPHHGSIVIDVDRHAGVRTTHAEGDSADVVECLETVVSSIAIRGEGDVSTAFLGGVQ